MVEQKFQPFHSQIWSSKQLKHFSKYQSVLGGVSCHLHLWKSSLLHPVPLTFQLPRSSQDWFKSSSCLDLVVCIPSVFLTKLSYHSQRFKDRGIKQCGRMCRDFVSVGFGWSSPAVQVRAAVISALLLNVCFSSCHREICQCFLLIRISEDLWWAGKLNF